MNKTRTGWVSRGDNVKVLATYGDDYATLLLKASKALVFSDDDDPQLICGGSIIPKTTFVNLGHFLEAAHVKPGKVLFGIGSKQEVSTNDFKKILIYFVLKAEQLSAIYSTSSRCCTRSLGVEYLVCHVCYNVQLYDFVVGD